MAEYICREAIIDDLEEEIKAGNVALDEDVWINKGLRIAIRDIKDIKTADVQPVKHGYWINHRINDEKSLLHGAIKDTTCSECGKSTPYKTDYCMHCGAKMDGDAE